MNFQIESTKITSQLLLEKVEAFLREEQPRRSRLVDYYRGWQGVKKGPVAQGRPNNQLTANFAKYITDVHTGYFLGLPPTLTFDRRRAQERVGKALEEASLEAMLYAAARDMSVCGEGYLLTYLVNDWLEWGIAPVLVFSGIFAVGYLVIWVVIYCVIKRNTEKINAALRQKQKNV